MEKGKLTSKEIKEGAPFAALSYVFFLWILVFIFRKDNRFAHFHARQGIVIFIGWAVCFFLPLFPLLGVLLYHLGLLLLPCLSLYGIYSALSGKMKPIPGVRNIAEKLII